MLNFGNIPIHVLGSTFIKLCKGWPDYPIGFPLDVHECVSHRVAKAGRRKVQTLHALLHRVHGKISVAHLKSWKQLSYYFIVVFSRASCWNLALLAWLNHNKIKWICVLNSWLDIFGQNTNQYRKGALTQSIPQIFRSHIESQILQQKENTLVEFYNSHLKISGLLLEKAAELFEKGPILFCLIRLFERWEPKVHRSTPFGSTGGLFEDMVA